MIESISIGNLVLQKWWGYYKTLPKAQRPQGLPAFQWRDLGPIKKDVENKGEDGGKDINMSGLPMDEGHGLCVGEVLLQAMQVVVL